MFGLFKSKFSEEDEQLIKSHALILEEDVPELTLNEAATYIRGALKNAQEIALRDFGKHSNDRGLGQRMLESPMGGARLEAGLSSEEIIQFWDEPPVKAVFHDQYELARQAAYSKILKQSFPKATHEEVMRTYLMRNVVFFTPENFRNVKASLPSGFNLNKVPFHPESKRRFELAFPRVRLLDLMIFTSGGKTLNEVVFEKWQPNL